MAVGRLIGRSRWIWPSTPTAPSLMCWANQRELLERQANELSEALVREVRFVDHLAPLHVFLIDLASVRQRLRDDLVSQLDATPIRRGAQVSRLR